MAFRSFTSPDPAEPVQFELDGQTYTCLGAIPGVALSDLGGLTWSAARVVAFLEAVIVDADLKRFRNQLRDKRRIIPIRTLGDITEWVISEIGGRPFDMSASSPNGTLPTPATSAAGSSPPASGPTP